MLPLITGAQPLADHHQHLFSPAAIKLTPGIEVVDASRLIAHLDAAGIRKAAVLSLAYQFSNPNKPPVENEVAFARAENDWTAEQVAKYPDRLVGFCSVNPLKEYALPEIDRCSGNPHLRSGLKLHFGNSDVDLRDPDHLDRVKRVFSLANKHRMAIVVHMRPSVTRKRPYGSPEARMFLDTLIPAAPDVPIQIAHLAGSGGYDDPAVDEAIEAFVAAVARKDSGMKRVWFEASGVAGIGKWEDRAGLVAQRIRQLGVDRVVYGSDGAVGDLIPAKAWALFRKLPLSDAEFRQIEKNLVPYFRNERRPK